MLSCLTSSLGWLEGWLRVWSTRIITGIKPLVVASCHGSAGVVFTQECKAVFLLWSSLSKSWQNASVFRKKDKGILKKLLQNCLCLSATTKAYVNKISLAQHNGVVFCNLFGSWWSTFCPNHSNFKTTFSLCYVYWYFFKGSLMLQIILPRVLNFIALVLKNVILWFQA